MTSRAILMDPIDNVATALADLAAESIVEVGAKAGGDKRRLTVAQDIPFGHKLALRDIPKGEPVMKYGWPIGVATDDIRVGCHVHTHNTRSVRGSATPLQGGVG